MLCWSRSSAIRTPTRALRRPTTLWGSLKQAIPQSTTRRVQDTFVFTGAEYGAQYTVTVTASHGTGWAQYTETDTVTCPTHTDNWNSPNFYDFDEDCTSNTPFVGWLANHFCRLGHSQLEFSVAYQELLGLKPALIEVEPVLLSRSCWTDAAQTRRVCRETWSENIILLKNPGIDWRALGITDWSGPEEVIMNTGTIIAFSALLIAAPTFTAGYILVVASVGTATVGQVYYYSKNAEGKEFVRLYPIKAAAVADAGTSLDVQGIANFQGCLAEYDLSPQTDYEADVHRYGTLIDIRISTYHYCLPD